MERIEITEDELIAALLVANEQCGDTDSHNAKTKRELLELTGWSEARVYERLHALRAAGRLGVTKVLREALDGAIRPVAAYYVRGDET